VTLTLSPPVRIAAICGILFAVLVPAGLMIMGRGGGGSADTTPHVINRHPFGPAAKTAHKARPAPATTHKATAKPAKKHVVAPAPKPTVNQAAIAAAVKAGLPTPVAQALGRSQTVVVSLYDPYSQVDGISFAEARAGAALAHVAFVPLNVLSQAQVGKLTEQLGLLPDPGVLVYVRPARLAVKIGGFADKETVAQAAANAG
jgi:hypothetical protein